MIAGDPAFPEENNSFGGISTVAEKQNSGDKTGGIDKEVVRGRVALIDQGNEVGCREKGAAGVEFDHERRWLLAEGGDGRRRRSRRRRKRKPMWVGIGGGVEEGTMVVAVVVMMIHWRGSEELLNPKKTGKEREN